MFGSSYGRPSRMQKTSTFGCGGFDDSNRRITEKETNIEKAIKDDDVASLIPLIESAGNINAARYRISDKDMKYLTESNLTLMHLAAYYNACSVLLYLNKKRNVPATVLSGASIMPFNYACLNGSTEAVEVLIKLMKANAKEGEDPIKDILENDYKDPTFSLPLFAVCANNIEILKLIFELGYDFSKYPENKKTCKSNILANAVTNKQSEMVQILLENDTSGKTEGRSPLESAIISQNANAVDLLVKMKSVNVNALTTCGETLLSIACFQCNERIVRTLINIVSSIDAPEGASSSAVHWICQSHNKNIIKMFLERGIDVNRVDSDGCMGTRNLVDQTSDDEAVEILDMLFEHGFNINYRKYGKKNEPLTNPPMLDFFQSIRRYPRVIEWFLSKGADLNQILVKTKTYKKEEIMTLGEFIRKSCSHVLLEVVEKYM